MSKSKPPTFSPLACARLCSTFCELASCVFCMLTICLCKLLLWACLRLILGFCGEACFLRKASHSFWDLISLLLHVGRQMFRENSKFPVFQTQSSELTQNALSSGSNPLANPKDLSSMHGHPSISMAHFTLSCLVSVVTAGKADDRTMLTPAPVAANISHRKTSLLYCPLTQSLIFYLPCPCLF